MCLPSFPRRGIMGHGQAASEITFGEMRETGTRGLLVYCSDYKCGHMMKIAPADADRLAG